jgi:hypothetical protein
VRNVKPAKGAKLSKRLECWCGGCWCSGCKN